MAPEQFDDAKHVDVRADIYSFGIMLFQMIEGKLPFKGQTWKDLEYQHKRQSSPRLNNSNLKLESIFQTCTAKDPADRFSDFGAVRNQLADIYERITGKPVPQPLEGKELDSAQWRTKV